MSMFIKYFRFLLYLDNTSTYDKLHRLIYIEVFPSSCGRFYINIAIYVEINLTTMKLMSGDICIDLKQVTSCYINWNTYIIVEVVEYRCFQLLWDAYRNIYPAIHTYSYSYLLAYIEMFQHKYIKARFTYLGIHECTTDCLPWLMNLYVTPSTSNCSDIHKTNYMKINLTKC